MMKETVLSRSVRLICAAGVAIGMQAAYAQEMSPEKVTRVEITGSSIRRVASETSLPVSVFSRADIEKSGVQTTEELIGQINTVSSAGGQVNAGQSGLTTYGKSAVSLRGLGSDKTLVLVNGRRLANFAGGATAGQDVNVNAIPLAAIDRVEVLQDGASGVYGSDAIGGVINFILRKEFNGLEISGTHGEPTRGGGAKANKVSVVGGWGDYDKDRFSVVGSLSFEKEGNLLGAEREFSKSDTNLPYYAGGATETGRIEGVWTFPGQATLLDAGPNARSAANPYGISGTGYGNPLAQLGKCGDMGMVARTGFGFTAGAPATTATGKNCGFDTGPFVSLVPNRKFIGGSANFRFKLNESNELFAEGLYSKNEFINPIQPAPLRQAFYAGNPTFAGSGVDPILLIHPSNPNYKIAADYLNSVGLGAMVGKPLGVSQRTFLLGSRTTKDVAKQDRFVIGAKGNLGGSLDYDVAFVSNSSETAGNVIDGFASIFQLSKVLNNPSTHWNPWAPLGAQSPEVAKLIDGTKYVGPTIAAKSKNEGIDAKVSGNLATLAGGPVALAAGLQARDESYDLEPAPATLTGDVIGLGGAITPVHAKRTVWALFSELNVPLTKSFEANLAVRQDSYSDFGKTFNYKGSLRFQPVEQVVTRASIGTGFRAPALTQLYAPQQINTSEQFIDPKFPGNGNIQVTSIAGGNPSLKPEESDQFSLGLVFAPVKQFNVSLDYYNIKIKGLIASPSAQEIVSGFRRGATGYAALVDVNGADEVTTIRQLAANVNSLKTDGVDVNMNFREKLGGGTFTAGLNGTWVRKFDLVNTSGETEHSVGTTVRPDGAPLVASPTGVILKWKHNLTAGYNYGAYGVTMTQRYYKGYEMAHDLDDNKMFVKGQALYDLVATYGGIKNLKLSVGVRNLFDKDPPLFISNGSQFQAGYDVYQYDPRGRFAYVSASYKF